jgi:type VI secretion system secreted protein VgrG
LPADLPATPHRDVVRPRVEGSQIAIIAGPAGEEIHCDDYGRVKVWFPWDREAKKDGSDTCWVRAVQNWAGTGWGGQIIPRIGMEALIFYENGDPDRPIIVGLSPNPQQKVPYELPANKTKSTFRTNTHKGKGFNELSFEDENGREEIYVHAQKDHTIHVENNRSKRIDNNQSESVGYNKSIEVGNNHNEIIGGNMTLMVGPNVLQKFVTEKFQALTDKISGLANKLGFPDMMNMGEGNLIIGVGKNKAETVMVSSTEVVGGGKATTVGGGYQLVVGGVVNQSVGIGAYEEVGHNKSIVVGKLYEVRVGKSKLLFTEDGVINITGEKITLEAEQSITLKASKIEMKKK